MNKIYIIISRQQGLTIIEYVITSKRKALKQIQALFDMINASDYFLSDGKGHKKSSCEPMRKNLYMSEEIVSFRAYTEKNTIIYTLLEKEVNQFYNLNYGIVD